MENCPIEVLVMIFSYLDLESLKSLSVIDAKKIKSAICSTIDIHYCKKIYGLWYSLHQEREYLENEYYSIVWMDEWYCSLSQEELSPILPLNVLTRIYIVKTFTNLQGSRKPQAPQAPLAENGGQIRISQKILGRCNKKNNCNIFFILKLGL